MLNKDQPPATRIILLSLNVLLFAPQSQIKVYILFLSYYFIKKKLRSTFEHLKPKASPKFSNGRKHRNHWILPTTSDIIIAHM